MTESDRETVVLRYRDGRTQRVRLQGDFSPRDFDLTVCAEDGDERRVNVGELKAVFFPKDPRQRSAEIDAGGRTAPPGSALAKVEFFDGEIIRGHVQHYSVANAGFFLYPTSPESNNDRIFVVATALTTVSLEG
jgi:hypothetical protein